MRKQPNSLEVSESLLDCQRDVIILLGNWQGKRHWELWGKLPSSSRFSRLLVYSPRPVSSPKRLPHRYHRWIRTIRQPAAKPH